MNVTATGYHHIGDNHLVPERCIKHDCDGRLDTIQLPQAYEPGYLRCERCLERYQFAYEAGGKEHQYFIENETERCPICGSGPLPLVTNTDTGEVKVHCQACKNKTTVSEKVQ